jgi:GNAT superfamily N-acetyltransferase
MEEQAQATLVLRDGRVVLVRVGRPDDVDDLVALFDGIGDEARQLRFFSYFHPRRELVAEMLDAPSRGGVQLVAHDERGRLVGEAGCIRLANGDGELAITVVDELHGLGLGSQLLDVLARAAAAAGMRNIEAEVLAANRPMLATLRRRWSAVVGRDGFTVLRLAIGTGDRLPAWPGPRTAPRVLLEARGYPVATEEALRALGVEVVTCPGPHPHGEPCPMVSGRGCELLAGADAVVFALPRNVPYCEAVLAGHVAAGVPVVITGEGTLRPPTTPPDPTRGAVDPAALADVVAELLSESAAAGGHPAA